jgi:hypothetical protein
MKLISYKYSYGGDTGFRPSNREEWHSVASYLYFDAEKWTMNDIYNITKTLYSEYNSLGYTWTLGDVMDNLAEVIVPFINKTEGVYQEIGKGWTKVKKAKTIDPNEHEVISWELNGQNFNYDYYKK